MKRLQTLFALGLLCGVTAAQAGPVSLVNNPSLYQPYQLAQAGTSGAAGSAGHNTTADDAAKRFEPSMFTSNKMHQYLGLGSLALATLAVLSPKEEKGPHEYFAKGSAALGGAAVASGLVVHWEDVELANGISDPDNLHALLSTIGALGFMAAVSQAPGEEHASPGIIGFTAMAIGIRLTW